MNKIETLNSLLESQFGLRVEPGPVEHLRSVLEHYDGKRDLFLRTMGEHAALQTPEYRKAFLISEAVRMLLREVQPRRIKRSLRKELSRSK